METAKIFTTGRSQAVRLPKAFRLSGEEVYVKHIGRGVLLIPKDDPWSILEEGLSDFEPGFTLERQQPQQLQRDALLP